MRNASICVIDYNRQLVRPLAIRTLEHEVADVACQILRLHSLPAILEAHNGGVAIRNAHPPGARCFAMQPVATRARISQRGVSSVAGVADLAGLADRERISYLAARATTRKHEARGQ